MRETTSAELTGWFAYLSVDDEAQTQRTELAILKALGRIKTQPAQSAVEDDEPVIDTTAPEFAKSFQGFINAPGQRS